MSRIAPSVAAAAATAFVVSALLSACTAPVTDSRTDTGVPASPTPTKTASPGAGDSTAAATEAVLVVAAVDADGRNVTASGYVQGVVTDQGTCVFTFSRNGSSFTVDHEATPDRSTTSCGTVQVPIASFQRGAYEVTVGMTVGGTPSTSPSTTLVIP
ncbi:MAG: hypothetical protein JF618_04535 [Leifsonia sp.]|nr:hypothetical protein [Leifsonia sp.]